MAEERRPLLEVQVVSKSFGGVQAVNNCSFVVQQGALTGLIGPNGAGKSTTVDLISGFQAADSGKIVFDGREIQHLPSHAISQLGLIRTFQTPREWKHLTTLENVLVASPDHSQERLWRSLFARRQIQAAEHRDRARARELLEEFGLFNVRNELAGNLSGGQKRLLEFARIAMARPRMVLLDEPQSGVNPVLGERMGEAIRRMVSDGITVLMIEHHLNFVERVCDIVHVMSLGQCIATGTMAELRRDEAVIDAYLGQVEVHA